MIDFLIDIGLVHILHVITWHYILIWPVALLSTLDKKNIWFGILEGGIDSIYFASVAVVNVLQNQSDQSTLILYSFVAGAFMIFDIFLGYKGARVNDIKASVWEGEIRYTDRDRDFIVSFITAIVCFVLILLYPILASNPVTSLFFFIKDWLLKTPYIHWIFKVLSVFVLLVYTWEAIALMIKSVKIYTNN